MWNRTGLTVVFSFCFLILGATQPQAIILDMPFGLLYYITDRLGMWQPGLLWVQHHRLLAIVCFFGCPILVSTILGYLIARISYKIWSEGERRSKVYTIVFLIAIFGLILTVRVEPASYFVSYYGYWTANY